MPKKKLFDSEADLAATLVAHLRSEGWDVYEEVCPVRQTSHRADVVAVREDVVRAIECKTSMGFAVLNQARYWVGWADEVYVAVPRKRGHWKQRQLADLAQRTAHEMLHVGVIEMGAKYSGCPIVDVRPPSKWLPPKEGQKRALLDTLRPEMQVGYAKAGEAAGGHWTPYKGTCKLLREYIEQQEGPVPLRQAVAAIKHHYAHNSSANQALPRLIRMGAVPGVRLVIKQGKNYVERQAPQGSPDGDPPTRDPQAD